MLNNTTHAIPAHTPQIDPPHTQIIQELQRVLSIWQGNSTTQQKANAWDAFTTIYPDEQKDMINAYVQAKEISAIGPKASASDRGEWRREWGEKLRQRCIERINSHDSDLLSSYIQFLRENTPSA